MAESYVMVCFGAVVARVDVGGYEAIGQDGGRGIGSKAALGDLEILGLGESRERIEFAHSVDVGCLVASGLTGACSGRDSLIMLATSEADMSECWSSMPPSQ